METTLQSDKTNSLPITKNVRLKCCNWESQSNNTPFISLSEDDVIRIVNYALSDNVQHSSTYKYAFFKSILDNLFNVDLDSLFLSFDSICLRYTEIYWNLVLYHGLHQAPENRTGKINAVERVLYDFCNKCEINYQEKQTICFFENLRFDLQEKITRQIKSVFKQYVIGAFCGDTEDQFYHFDIKKSDGIYLNNDVFIALVKYKTAFERQNYFEWIKFLEKINKEEDSYALANKLDSSTERKNLFPFRQVLLDFGQNTCFYCGKLFNQNKTYPVDHFIPWSYVKDDKLWNFVLACPDCNTNKSNILPKEKYLSLIKIRNEKLCNYDNKLVKTDFKTYTFSKLTQMYHSAIYNGFKSEWTV